MDFNRVIISISLLEKIAILLRVYGGGEFFARMMSHKKNKILPSTI